MDRTYSKKRNAAEATQAKWRKLKTALAKYAEAASFARPAAQIVQMITGFHFFTPVAQLIVKITKSKQKSLVTLKSDAVNLLRQLDRRLIVTIDDIDRLEPAEAIEALRLVKAVADFPNVVYIACFDRNILSEAISQKLGVSDGNAFLEKIFQAVITLPLPQSFDLRRWLADEVKALAFSNSADPEADGPAIDRLEALISAEGERRLHTPRDVVRVLNLFKLHWPPVRGRVDVGDMAWLVMLKVTSPDLHSWIMEYVEETSQSQLGAQTSGPLKQHFKKRLDEILTRAEWMRPGAYRTLSEVFPSIQATNRTADGELYPDSLTMRGRGLREAGNWIRLWA
jgi:hypothetical protein